MIACPTCPNIMEKLAAKPSDINEKEEVSKRKAKGEEEEGERKRGV